MAVPELGMLLMMWEHAGNTAGWQPAGTQQSQCCDLCSTINQCRRFLDAYSKECCKPAGKAIAPVIYPKVNSEQYFQLHLAVGIQNWANQCVQGIAADALQ